jgi:hypothetical protein
MKGEEQEKKQIILLLPRSCVVKNNALTYNGTCGFNLKEIQQIKELSIVSKLSFTV